MKAHNYSIVLFTYKRLNTVERIIDVLALHSFNNIFIISDMQKNPQTEVIAFPKIVTYAKNKLKDKSYKTFMWNKHVGLRHNIMSGLDMAFQHDRNVVILEDDAIPTQSFFEIMDEGFNLLHKDEKIAHVSGYTPLQLSNESFDKIRFNLTSFPSTFAWATTNEKWSKIHVNVNFKNYIKVMKKTLVKHKNLFFNLIFTYNLVLMKLGKLDSWATQWMFSIILHDQFCLIPNYSFVKHEGDSNGTHTKIKPRYVNLSPIERNIKEDFDLILGNENDSRILKYVYRSDLKGLILMTIIFFFKLVKSNKRPSFYDQKLMQIF